MQFLKTVSGLFGFGQRIQAYNFDATNAQKQAIQAIEKFDIFPETSGQYSSVIFRKMIREDSHLAGLYRRIIFALLSAKITVSCEDKAIEALIHKHLGYDPERPSLKFSRLLKEIASSLQYGYSLHEKRIVNDKETGETMLRLRRLQPVDVWEFTVTPDGDLISVSETYSETIHGINMNRRFIGKGQNRKEVVDLAADTLIHTAPLQEGYNYWGESILEPAVPDWVLKRIYRYANSVLQGRFAVPIALAKTNVRKKKDAEVFAGQLVVPATDPNRMLVTDTESSLELISPSGNTDIIQSIEYCDFAMSKLLLEQFVDTGDKKYGGRETTSEAIQEFHTSLNFFEMAFAEGIKQIADEVKMLNFGENNNTPIEVLWEDLEFRGREKLIKLLAELTEQGLLHHQIEDEMYIRESTGMPPMTEETIKKVEKMIDESTKMKMERGKQAPEPTPKPTPKLAPMKKSDGM